MLKAMLKQVLGALLRWNMACLLRMVSPECSPGLPCTVYVNFNSSAVRLSGYTAKHDGCGNLSLTLTWNAPADVPIAVIGEDSAWPPDTLSLATMLIACSTSSGERDSARDGVLAYPRSDAPRLVCAWCTPKRAGVIVMASSSAHNTSV